MQLIELKAAKVRLEVDWTDKTDAYDIEAECIKLKNDSPLILWKPGATRFPGEWVSSLIHRETLLEVSFIKSVQ